MKNIKDYRKVLNEAESQSQGVLNKRLLDAARNGDLDNVKGLLDRGAEVDARDRKDWTALHLAALKGHVDIATLLLDRGAEVDARTNLGSTPLHWAAANGHIDTAKLLLDRGAEVDVRNKFGSTPLKFTGDWGHTDTARLLIQHGADPLKAFEGLQQIIGFFKGDISWMPEHLKEKINRAIKVKGIFGK